MPTFWKWKRLGFDQSAAGQMVEQVEHWSLHRGVNLPELSDEAIDRVVLPLVGPGNSR